MRPPAEPSLALHFLLLSLATLCGCFTPFEVECGEDAHCNRFPGGLCHTNPQTERRWCSYPDAACATGYRYSDLDVGDGVSAVCTGEPPARCDPTAEFGEPTLVPNINSAFDEVGMTLTADELTVYVIRSDGYSTLLLASQRTFPNDEFSSLKHDPTLERIVMTSGIESSLSPTADGLLLYFSRYVSGEEPHVILSARANRDGTFDEGSPVSIDGHAVGALGSKISVDGQTLYWHDWNDWTLRTASRANNPRSFLRQFVALAMGITDYSVSADDLTLYYSRGTFAPDVFVSRRASRFDSFEPGALVPKVNSVEEDMPLVLTSDGCLLYLKSKRPGGLGGYDIWVARRSR